MKELLTVVSFTIKEAITRKSFIISMIIILLIILIGFNVPNILNKIMGDDQIRENILIIDEENIFADTMINLKSEDDSYNYTIVKTGMSLDEIKEKLKIKAYDSCLIFKKDEETIKIDYIVESMMAGQSVPQDLINNFSTQYTAVQIQKAGITQEQLQKMFTNFDINVVQTDESAAKGNLAATMIMSVILFYAIYFCAYQVSTSITTEKTSKIIETLVTSTSPKTIVLGKTIGIGIVGFFQVIVITCFAAFSAKAFLPQDIINSIFNLSAMTPMFWISSLVYFMLGYVMYALLYALTGSMVSKPEDIQSANTPVAILAVIGFYLSYFSMMNTASSINKFAAIFPISSPFCMPFRMLVGSAHTNEIITSIAILLICIVVIAKISIKIYSNAILNYGTKMSIKDVIKVYKTKN